MNNALRIQVAGMMIISYIIINYFSAKRRKTRIHIVFSAMLLMALVNVIFDFFLVHIFVKTGVWYDGLNRGYLSTIAVTLMFVHDYIVSTLKEKGGKVFLSQAVWEILTIFVAALCFILPIEYVNIGNWYYSQGIGVTVLHVYVACILLDALVTTIVNRSKLDKRSSIALISSIVIQLATYAVQLFDTTDIITSMGNSLMIICLYVISENLDILLIEQLEYERDRATVANNSKSSFIAHISHEIRTPINAILGMDEMIIRESKDEKTKQYANDISQAAHTLYGIINDVLDMSKMDSGKMEIFPVEYKLDQLIFDTVSMVKPRVESKQLDFFVEVNSSLPSGYYGDDVHIKQIITNLLTNAVKYTHEGFVKISVDGEFKGDFIDLIFEVKDTGIGIKEEDINKLFIAFERIEESRNRNIEGAGLGMNITNNLLKLMGSRLNVRSVYGEGTIFSFVIRQRIVNPEAIGDYSAFSKAQNDSEAVSFKAPSVKLLVVDDNALNRRVFVSLLARTQICVDEADSGFACLDMIKKEQYDIIFLDHLMPDMDGVDTLAKMKEDKSHPNQKTPVIMLTANTFSDAQEVYRQAGFDAYLSKPVFSNQLERMIRTYVPSYKIVVSQKPTSLNSITDLKNWKAELPKIRGIDYDEATKHLMTREMLYEAFKEFHRSILKEATVMDQLIANIEDGDNAEQFRIKAHALKSSAATIGAEMLSEGARDLEMAAKEKSYDIIREKYPYMINYYRSFYDKLAIFDENPGEKKTDIDFPQVLALVEMVRLEMFDMNKQNAIDALDEIENYQYPEEIQNKITGLRESVMQYDSDKTGELVDELLTMLRILRNT